MNRYKLTAQNDIYKEAWSLILPIYSAFKVPQKTKRFFQGIQTHSSESVRVWLFKKALIYALFLLFVFIIRNVTRHINRNDSFMALFIATKMGKWNGKFHTQIWYFCKYISWFKLAGQKIKSQPQADYRKRLSKDSAFRAALIILLHLFAMIEEL